MMSPLLTADGVKWNDLQIRIQKACVQSSPRVPPMRLIRICSALQKLTSLALRLAHMVVKPVKETITVVRQRAVVEVAAPSRASQLMNEARQQLLTKAHRCALGICTSHCN